MLKMELHHEVILQASVAPKFSVNGKGDVQLKGILHLIYEESPITSL
jgi:hypothetical protein